VAASPEQSTPADPTRGWPGSPSEFDPDPSSPGNWSTVATPGTGGHVMFDMPTSPPPGGHGDPRRATVSGELEELPEQPATPEESLFGGPHTRRPTQSPSQPPEPGPALPPGDAPSHIETYGVGAIDPAVNTPPQPHIQSSQQIRPTPVQIQQPRVVGGAPPPPAASVSPPQLTPKQISQAQKHCRYAISALDYEDFERARKDLLDALKIIEG